MARRNELVYALNAGGVDKAAVARIDLEKMRLAGEHPVKNWLPRVLGPMGLRPGLEYLSTVSAQTRLVEFIRDSSTTALLAFQDLSVAVYDADGAPIAVANPASTITNPTLTAAGGGWSDVSDSGDGDDGAVTLAAGGSASFLATRWRAAALEQSVSVAGGDQSTAHTLRVEVARGPIFFRVGSSSGAEDIFGETELLTGTHLLTFTPGTGTIYIRFRSEDTVVRVLTRCQFQNTYTGGAGYVTLPTPWTTAALEFLSWDQSQDVMFIGDGTYQQRRIERRGEASWSIVLYQSRNGPLELPKTDKISLTPSAFDGNGTLTSNVPYFKSSHVGCLFELTQGEQHIVDQLHEADQTTDFITVTGLFSSTKTYDDRNFGYTIDVTTGSFVGTIALESSTDGEIWVTTETHAHGAGDVSTTYNDEQSNLLIEYRLRVIAYTSGYADVTITQLAGSTTGLVRVTEYTNSTTVNTEVVTHIGSTNPTRIWRGPVWSDDLGWPRVPRLFDGRLWWFRGDRAFGSIVDDYDNYDDTVEGDAGPVIRSIGSGPAEGARWALDMQRLIAGTSGFEASIRSSSFDEPITPTAFTVRNASTLGVSYVPPVKVDRGAIFAQKSNRRLYELMYSVETNDYTSKDVSRLIPSAFTAGIVDMAVQRQPDTRVYMVLNDGSCVVLTYERDDEVVAFTTLTTVGGSIQDVAVLPDDDQDDVYFIVSRGGQRYLERLSPEYEQRSVSTCTLLDSYTVLTGTISSISGATRFASETVQIWADGQRRTDVTLDGSGNGTLDGTYSRVVYGKTYDAEFQSVKLAYAAQLGTAVGQTKIVRGAGLVLADSCLDGISIGKDSTDVGPLPDYVNGALRTDSQFFAHYDEDIFPIYSDWDADARVFLRVNSAEGPCTVQAIVLDVETRDGAPSRSDQGNR